MTKIYRAIAAVVCCTAFALTFLVLLAAREEIGTYLLEPLGVSTLLWVVGGYLSYVNA